MSNVPSATTTPKERQRVKIFGDRNTSTNALRALIAANSDALIMPSVAAEVDPGVEVAVARLRRLRAPTGWIERRLDQAFADAPETHSWKHCLTDFDTVDGFRDVLTVVCVRHPASWLVGLRRRPYHCLSRRRPSDWAGFLTMRWRTVARERMGRDSFTPPELYNRKALAYVSLRDRLAEIGARCRIVRFEDFAHDQRACFDSLGVSTSAAPFTALERSTKDPTKNRAHYRDYYARELWRDELDAAAARLIDGAIDWDVAARLGYPRD